MTLITSEERASQAVAEAPTGPSTSHRKKLSNHNMLLKGCAGRARLPLLTAPVHVKSCCCFRDTTADTLNQADHPDHRDRAAGEHKMAAVAKACC